MKPQSRGISPAFFFQDNMKPDRELAERISVLADEIWHECYASVLPDGQIDYMLRTYHSTDSILREMSEG